MVMDGTILKTQNATPTLRKLAMTQMVQHATMVQTMMVMVSLMNLKSSAEAVQVMSMMLQLLMIMANVSNPSPLTKTTMKACSHGGAACCCCFSFSCFSSS